MELNINGQDHEIAVYPHQTLLEVIREQIGLTGTKEGCGMGACGSCTVMIDDKAVLACLTLALSVEGKKVHTVEGLAEGQKLTPLQESFVEHGAVQCGFCTPGMVMAAKAFLDENRNPTEDEIKKNIIGHLCRCTGYFQIVEAIKGAAEKLAIETIKT